MGAHGEAGFGVRADLGIRDLCAVLGSGNTYTVPEPPFGELIAVDLASGDIAWRSVLGRIEALEAIGVRDTGTLNLGGSIATAGGLVFIGATNDSRFRAFDSRTGKLLWEVKLEASGHTTPITYMGRDRRQYVALMAAGGGGFLAGGVSNSLVAFALPDVDRRPLPVSVSKAVAAAAAARRGVPKVGASGRRRCRWAGRRRWSRRLAGPVVTRRR